MLCVREVDVSMPSFFTQKVRSFELFFLKAFILRIVSQYPFLFSLNKQVLVYIVSVAILVNTPTNLL